MGKELSFMQSINKFDEVLKREDITDEVRAYCQAMKDFFIKFEQANAIMNEKLRKLTGESSIIN